MMRSRSAALHDQTAVDLYYSHSFVVDAAILGLARRRERVGNGVVITPARHPHTGLAGWMPIVSLPERLEAGPWPWKNVLSSCSRLSEAYKLVWESVGTRRFNLFVPQASLPVARILRQHPRCQSISIIEEGLASIAAKPPGSRSARTLGDWARGGPLVAANEFIPHGYADAIAISPDAFEGFERRVEVEPAWSDLRVDCPPTSGSSVVFACQPLAFMKESVAAAFVAMIREAAVTLRKSGHEVYWKLHPHQLVNGELDTVSALFDSVDCATGRLSPAVSLEVMAARRHLTVIGWNTSVGLYLPSGSRFVSLMPDAVERYALPPETVSATPIALRSRWVRWNTWLETNGSP